MPVSELSHWPSPRDSRPSVGLPLCRGT
jgi:hypothetical protein